MPSTGSVARGCSRTGVSLRANAHRHARRKVEPRRDRLRWIRLAVVEGDAQDATALRCGSAVDERSRAHDVDIDDIQRAVGRECDTERIGGVRVLSEMHDVDARKRATGDGRAVIGYPHDRRIADRRTDRPTLTRRITSDRDWERQVVDVTTNERGHPDASPRIEAVGPAIGRRAWERR